MFPASVSDWLALLGIVIPLTIASISAAIYVRNQTIESRHREYKKFFEITDSLSNFDGSLVSKVAAVYELRNYKKYKDIIIRIFENVPVNGDSAELLRREMQLTSEYLQKLK